MLRLLCLAVGLMLAVPGFAQSLGEASFPNSGAEEAQESFLHGLLLLHSFEYDHAREAFQEARNLDPDFAMTYWGEALTYNHPIWQQQDREAALAVLAEMPEGARSNASERERAYLATMDILYGDGDKETRDDTYAAAMGELATAYPDDLNAATFHALAILGTAHEGRDFDVYDRAGQIALAAFERNPAHPGAAHYVIHSYDDPLNARKALEAARAYSEIAPAAPHALHMPTHIYFALGMWDEVAELNRRSYEAARSRDEAAGQPLGGHGWHPLYWLHYAELQRGRFEEARRLFNEALELAESGQTSRGWSSLAAMRANYVVETRNFYDESIAVQIDHELLSPKSAQLDDFANALIAIAMHAREWRETLRFHELREEITARMRERIETGSADDPVSRILMLQLDSWGSDRGNFSLGLEFLDEAAALEDTLPLDFGPPSPALPTHELRGELLVRQSRAGQNLRERLDRAIEAQAEFERALARAPMRLRSLRGLHEAATATGDNAAVRIAQEGLCLAMRASDSAILEQEMLIGSIPGACRRVSK